MATKKKAEQAFDCLAVTNVQVYPFREEAKLGNMLGFATVVLNDQLTIRGLRVMRGENGMFVGYPTDPFSKGEDLRSTVFPITRALREHIENCVLEKYLYETKQADVKFHVELTHKALCGAILHLEIIATNDKEAKLKAKENAIEIIPATKDKGDWDVLKVEQHE